MMQGIQERSSHKDFKRLQDKQKAVSLWNRSESAQGTLVEKYFTSRHLTVTPPDSLRFHSKLDYWEQDNQGTWKQTFYPALIAQIQRYPGDDCMGIHRTYLRSDGWGKAPVACPKKMLGDCGGGAVRFAGETLECIALGEGIETCLSYWQENYYMTVWACLSVSGMKSIVLPPCSVTFEVVIIADHDAAGISAGKELATRLTKEGRKVYLITPSQEGADMNSLLGEHHD